MRRTMQKAVAFAAENSLLMILGTVVALIWANADAEGYLQAVLPLRFAVNDLGMVFFFGLATKEIIEATAPGAALHSYKRASVPVIAAAGGMAGPALVYLTLATLTGRPDLLRGWAIPTATDIAFSYLVVRYIFGAASPAVSFLLLLAIADDAFGLALLAVFYPTGVVRPLLCVTLLAAAMLLAWALRRRRVRNFWPYVLLPGSLAWIALYVGGLHPALALVPILPFVPHDPSEAGMFVTAKGDAHLPLNAFEAWWQRPVECILFLFALTNAGVALSNTGAGTWIVLAAFLIGKPLGIVVSSQLAVAAGLHLPAGLARRDLLVVGLTAAIGFTVALFFATAAFPAGALLRETKLGALFSLAAVGLAPAFARVTGVGRWERQAR